MKTSKILFGLLIIGLASCEDFLEVPPKSAVTPSNFFQTESDFEQAVTGAYAPLQSMNNSDYSDWNLAEMRSDNTHFIYNAQVAGHLEAQHVADFLVETDNPGVANMYNFNYVIITRANHILAQIDDADIDEDVRNNFKGQACFLRALAYFKLVRFFGGVPLFLEPVSTLEDTKKPRATEDDVYAQIFEDATTAANLLPDVTEQDPGKATSGAANTLLGEVYITLGQWSNAENALSKVTGYSLLDDYADIFDPNNEGNEEMIFEIEYLEGTSLDLASTFPYLFLPQLDDPSVITGVSPSNPGGSGYNVPTPDLIASYEDTVRDERYAASIARYSGPSSMDNVTFVSQPYIKKYQHSHALYGETGQNWPVYRYAEVLLMLAEAINEQGNRQAVAESYLNQVRNRAGLNDTSATSQNELRDIILHERRIELAFENKRWHDLVRTGRAVEVMNAYGERIKANPENYYYYTPNTGPISAAYNVTENKLLYPIPFREMELNPDLEQNPR